jgi:acetyl/propionyl-CoA carboxylase alpha subunit
MKPRGAPAVERIGPGVYRVEIEGRMETVFVAGTPADRWVQWNGRVFRRPFEQAPARRRHARSDARQELSAPMPATVRKVLVGRGDAVRKGDTLVVLEAMKMELPLRAGADAVVAAIHCAEGDLVQPEAVLVELD